MSIIMFEEVLATCTTLSDFDHLQIWNKFNVYIQTFNFLILKITEREIKQPFSRSWEQTRIGAKRFMEEII